MQATFHFISFIRSYRSFLIGIMIICMLLNFPMYRLPRRNQKNKKNMMFPDLSEFDSLLAYFEGDERGFISDPAFKLGFGQHEYDERKEILSDWITTEKQKFLYTYDFGDDWRHQIVLEKIVEPEDGIFYPYCGKVSRGKSKEDDEKMRKSMNMELKKLCSISNKRL